MWYKILFSTIIIALIAMIQITFLGSFGSYWSSFNLLLAILIILLFLIDFNIIVYFSIISGLFLDIYSSLPFGVFMLSTFLSIAVSYFLLLNFFTNRSFYSVVFVGLSAITAFNVVFLSLSGIIYLFGISDFYVDSGYWIKLIYQFINISIILISLFFVINLFSRKFKPNFIRS